MAEGGLPTKPQAASAAGSTEKMRSIVIISKFYHRISYTTFMGLSIRNMRMLVQVEELNLLGQSVFGICEPPGNKAYR